MRAKSDSTWRTQEVRHVGSDTIAPDFGASQLRGLAKKTKDGPQARRLLALAAIYDGATRTEAAMIGGVTLQIVRDWVVKFNESGPDGLLNRKSPGQPSRLNDMQRAALAGVIESGPIPAIHGVVRWRMIDLANGSGRSSGSRRQADAQPRAARHGLPQALGAAAASRPGRGRHRAF